MIVTVTPTIMDGTVVRWYADMRAYEHDQELASASRREAVAARGAPPDVCRAAEDAYSALRRDRRADLTSLATHRRDRLSGPLVPVEPPA